ncbi:hypothetical protein [Actinoplanes aureus]|jgi:hypothetical protein|uniref:Uncharacterized protein n=1 Tax=Actinoplanes aureus TaxID=2792083 RepID=A0A931G191_9ACTN|nr:hypothetical protein [Actinoplanes aureus]MBG0567628.1 hypothetical protein [Actinoplanes aureus]
MKRPRPGHPRIDDTVTAADLHERCEQVAVPAFDYMSGPVMAFVDGLLHIDPDEPPPRRRYTYTPKPTTEAERHTDDAAYSAGHMLADITRIRPRR